MAGLHDSKSITLKNNNIEHLLSQTTKYNTWIQIEKAVAQAQFEEGIIPKEAWEAINQEVTINNFSQERYQHYLSTIGHGFYSFVETILEDTSDLTKKYFHYGITTQNIQQSAQMIILNKLNKEFFSIINKILHNLALLAQKHKDSIMPGRTHSKHAVPTTFGYVVSSWIEEIAPSLELLKIADKQLCQIMMGGAIGAFNSLGEKGAKVQNRVAQLLGMPAMKIPSRNIQLPKVQYISAIANVANGFHKIAEAVYNNSVEELHEFTEYADPTQIGSSTMPHKMNPKLSKGIIANSAKIYDLLISSYYANTKPYESNSASYMILDANITELTAYFTEVLIRMESLSKNIVFHKEIAYDHLIKNEGLDNSEYVMMKLSEKFGKFEAHQIVHDIAIKYQTSSNLTYLDALMQNPDIAHSFSREDVEEWLIPENYIGLSVQLTENTIKDFL